MRFTRKFSQIMLALSLGCIYTASAEDIDIFLKNEAVTGARPNVLLVLDNAASNNSNITMLDGSSGTKLEMLRQVLNNIIDPLKSPYFPACTVTEVDGVETRTPDKCVTRAEVDKLLSNINVGLMIANPSGADTGGYVRYHVRPMNVEDNRNALVSKINPGIPQANNAPYAKSMHEAYQYFGGKPAYVGFSTSPAQYDTAAKSGLNYVSPITDSCQDNYILFVGNGGPDSGEENDTQKLLSNIGGILTSDPIKFSPSNLTSSWFDEYARTLKKQDVSSIDGIQNVTTYTIAVQNPAENNYKTAPSESARELLKSAAQQGGGEYFEANNGQQVMRAFIDMIQKFQAIDSVFAASTLPVSVNVRGTFLNQVYMGQFRPDANGGPRWPGNLKQYQIALVGGQPVLADRFGKGVEDTSKGFILPDKTSFWTTDSNYWTFEPMGTPATNSDAPDGNIVEKGGAAQRMRQDFATSQVARKLYTCNGACTAGLLSSTEFVNSNTGITKEILGVADDSERTALINWVRGADNKDNEDKNGVSTDIRARIHGDLLHSRPAVVNYNRTNDERDIMVYYGTNGGIFHAVKGGQDNADGGEKWGMVFPEFLSRLKRLRDNSPDITVQSKPYFADGAVSLYQKDANDDGKYVAADGDKVYLYVGMRRGGRFAYALDVSDPDAPKHLWKIDNTKPGFAELGQTWSSLRPAKIRALENDPIVIFGAGYDPENEDVLPSKANDKGRGIFFVNGRTGELVKHLGVDAGMASMPGDLAVLDRDSDGFFDRIYAGDTKGNVWRVDIDDANPDNWKVHKLASLGGGGSYVRKFLNKPDVVFGGEFDAILLGSGDREHPFETTVTNRFYMLKDPNMGLIGGLICAGADATPIPCTDEHLEDMTGDTVPSSIEKGWYVTLAAGEKVVGSAITVFGTTFFGTNMPTPPEAGVCSSNLGEARLYAVGFDSGLPSLDLNADGVVDSKDLFANVAGGGFPPPPVYAKVEVKDGDVVRTVDVVCTGSHCLAPGNVTTTTKRFRTYWHIDSNLPE